MVLDNMLEHLLQNRQALPQLDYYFNMLSEEQQQYFINRINKMKREKLYKSPIHGKYHSEKVCLFAYLLGCMKGLNEVDLEIITDAAMYHDFKRENDFEEPLHGYVSARHIEEIISLDGIYADEVNLNILKAIIDYHSQQDHRIKSNFFMYDLPDEEYDRYVKLAKILKDADGLDRKRFSEKCQAALDSKFLRFEESGDMIALAEEINQMYYQIIEEHQSKEVPLKKEFGNCFHSIGFDFFRIGSVLENGILSFSELKKLGLKFPRNFDGGNANRWVSVVPADLLYKNSTAFKTFIQNGIVFLCDNQDLYRPMDYNQKSLAILKGLPYDKSGYSDERYVFGKIESEDLLSMFVTSKHAYKDIKELSYLYNSLDYDTLERRVIYYLNQMQVDSFDGVPELIEPMAKYKKLLDEYQTYSLMDRNKFAESILPDLENLLEQINSVIQLLIHRYYACLLNKNEEDKITVSEVMEYEIKKTGLKVTKVNGTDEVMFFMDNQKKLK